MSSSKKLITVIGSTGDQGGSVVKAILSDPKMRDEWVIRGITRDTSKASAKNLASQGVEMVSADVSNRESLAKAFKGAYAVFAVTNYWEKMDMDLEIQQGKLIADVAKECGIQHFIWSSLHNVTDITNGKLPNVHHFDSKAKVEDYIRSINLPASYVMPGFYMSNFPGDRLRLFDGAWTMFMPVPASAPIPLLAAVPDMGKYVKGALLNREKALGKRVLAATKYYTLGEMLEDFKKVFPEAGKNVKFHEEPKEDHKANLLKAGLPDFAAQELMENMLLLNQGGYYGGEPLEWSHSLVEDKLTTWAEFIKTAKAFQGLK